MIFTITTADNKWCEVGKGKYGDKAYTDYLVSWLASLTAVCPEEDINIYILFKDESHIAKLVEKSNKAYLGRINKKVNIIYRINDSDEPKAENKTYAVCYRTVLFKELLNEGHDYVAYFDSDIIFRKPIDNLITMIDDNMYGNDKESHLAVMHRPFEKMKKNRFQAGVILMNNTPAIKKMVFRWDYLTQKNIMWFQDQRCLYDAWVENKDKVELLNLESKYNDWHFNDDGHVWHCKNHVDDPKWEKEFGHYYILALEDVV